MKSLHKPFQMWSIVDLMLIQTFLAVLHMSLRLLHKMFSSFLDFGKLDDESNSECSISKYLMDVTNMDVPAGNSGINLNLAEKRRHGIVVFIFCTPQQSTSLSQIIQLQCEISEAVREEELPHKALKYISHEAETDTWKGNEVSSKQLAVFSLMFQQN